MKKSLVLALSFYSICVFSQIKIAKDIITEPRESKIISSYDSISDFTQEKTSPDYIKYIDEELFLPPLKNESQKTIKIIESQIPNELAYNLELRTKTPKLIYPDTIIILKDEWKNNPIASYIKNNKKEFGIYSDIYMPYYTITLSESTKMSENTKPTGFETEVSMKTTVFNKKYKITFISDVNGENIFFNDTQTLNRIRIWLETENKDTIYFNKEFMYLDKSLNPFIINGFYEYHKNRYVKNYLMYYKQTELDWDGNSKNFFVDIKTGERVVPQQYDVNWYCADIVFLDLPNEITYRPYYILTNGKNFIKVKLGELINSGFITKEELELFLLMEQMENQQ
ncbi:MAG: hypothetical protein JXL97_17320 [Bacteroidales bacterium]|nr:hypothetical protein [Bacteroidales bacterium]